MRGWALQHVHLVIIIDALLHVGMSSLILLAWVIFGKMVKRMAGRDTAVNILLFVMGVLMAFISWYVVALGWFCFRHYVEWWSR
jgi:threonine/homoserine/homoserine lactone efflux protein